MEKRLPAEPLPEKRAELALGPGGKGRRKQAASTLNAAAEASSPILLFVSW